MKKILSLVLFLTSLPAFATATALTVKAVSETPVLLGTVACDTANGNSLSNVSENVLLYAKNTTGASSATVTVTVQTASITIPGFGPLTKSSITQTLAAGAEYLIGPFPGQAFNDSGSLVQLTCGGAGNVGVTFTAFSAAKLMKIP